VSVQEAVKKEAEASQWVKECRKNNGLAPELIHLSEVQENTI